MHRVLTVMEESAKQAKKSQEELATTIGNQIAAAVSQAITNNSNPTSTTPRRVPIGINGDAMEEASPLSLPIGGKRNEMEEDASPDRANAKKRDMKTTPQTAKSNDTQTATDTTEIDDDKLFDSESGTNPSPDQQEMNLLLDRSKDTMGMTEQQKLYPFQHYHSKAEMETGGEGECSGDTDSPPQSKPTTWQS
jgi:hypothetical protein